jgi:hypothetical protein
MEYWTWKNGSSTESVGKYIDIGRNLNTYFSLFGHKSCSGQSFGIDSKYQKKSRPQLWPAAALAPAFDCGGAKNSLRSNSLDPSPADKHSARRRCMGFKTLKKLKSEKHNQKP